MSCDPACDNRMFEKAIRRTALMSLLKYLKSQNKAVKGFVKALSHGAIFLATYNAILLLRDVNL